MREWGLESVAAFAPSTSVQNPRSLIPDPLSLAMPDPFLCFVIYLIWWWLAFFAMLPLGVRSSEEAGAAVEAGNDPGAPHVPNIGKKMLWASASAAALWVITIVLIAADPFNMRPDLTR